MRVRRAHYAGLLTHVEALGTSLAPDVDWAAIRPKVTLAQDYRTTRSDLRIELVRLLKVTAAPVSVNEIDEHIIAALKLSFASKKERERHRAVVVDALHDLRKGPPSLVDCTEQCTFGKFNQPEQRWFFARGAAPPDWPVATAAPETRRRGAAVVHYPLVSRPRKLRTLAVAIRGPCSSYKRRVVKKLALTALAAISLSLYIHPAHAAPTVYRLNHAAIGCATKKEVSSLYNAMAAHDDEGLARMFVALAGQGECVPLKAGTIVYLEDTAILDGLAEVRPRGQAFTVWVPEDVVEEAK